MKWFILALLFSCGHKTPPAQDVADSDGDHVPNYLEVNSELAKYVAEVVQFSSVEGKLRLEHEGKEVSINFSNNFDAAQSSIGLLTKSLAAIAPTAYFTEYARLYPQKKDLALAEGIYHVSLSLSLRETPKALVLTDGKSEYRIGDFSKTMDFRLSTDELRKILDGKLYFQLKKEISEDPYSVDQNVRSRTYRVHFYDGVNSLVHYVSKEISFARYLKLSGIESTQELNDLSSYANDPKVYWWTRDLGARGFVIVKASMKDILNANARSFDKTLATIDRINGKSAHVLRVIKSPDTRYFVRLRAKRAMNEFSVSQTASEGEFIKCVLKTRKARPLKATDMDQDAILEELAITSGDRVLSTDDYPVRFVKGMDFKGGYLEIAFERTPEDFTLSLPTRATSTYVPTGTFENSCVRPLRNVPMTNEESQLVITAESYVEKMD